MSQPKMVEVVATYAHGARAADGSVVTIPAGSRQIVDANDPRTKPRMGDLYVPVRR